MTTQNFSVDSLLSNAFDGLTVKIEDNAESVAALLDRFKLRWSVEKRPLFAHVEGMEPKATPYFGVIRTDNGTCFNTCKDSYVPFQNSELAELLIRISQKTGYEIHSGGSFNGGGRVYLQLNTGNEIKNLGKNLTTVKGYVTGLNSHDGTLSLKWGAVNFTVCCGNTFAQAARELQESARHTASIHDRVERSIRSIEGIKEAEQSLFERFIKLSEVAVKPEHIAKIVANATGVDINLKGAEAAEKYSTYAHNRTTELLSSISREMGQKGETLWGLFSGVTHYTSHVLPVPKRDNARLESKYTGSALTLDNESLAIVTELGGLN